MQTFQWYLSNALPLAALQQVPVRRADRLIWYIQDAILRRGSDTTNVMATISCTVRALGHRKDVTVNLTSSLAKGCSG